MAMLRIGLATVLVLVSMAVGCGDNDNSQPNPNPTFTPADFVCRGPQGPPTACHAPSTCCGNACISGSAPCCTVPAGFLNAGAVFACARNQACCGPGCIQVGSPCT